MADLRRQARNPYSRSWLWIPGSRCARPGMTVLLCPAESTHDPPRRAVLSGRRSLGRRDRARHAARFVVGGGGRLRRAAGDRIPGSRDQLRRAGSDGRGRGRLVPARRLRRQPFGGAVPRQLAGSSGQFLRRAESRRPHRASFPARWRDRAVAQAERFRRARAGHQRSRDAVADGAEISRKGPGRPVDRLPGRRLGRGRQSAHADPGQSRDHHLQGIHRRRHPSGGLAKTLGRRCRAAAIYRRHHRPAEGRDAQPWQPDLGGVGLRRLGQAVARRAQ